MLTATAQLVLTTGEEVDMFPNGRGVTEGCNQRSLIVAPGQHMMGMVGQIAKDLNVFTHLGIMQSYRPNQDPATDFGKVHPEDDEIDTSARSQLTQDQKLLWTPWAARMPTSVLATAPKFPIWRHPSMAMQEFEMPKNHFSIPVDMIPHHALVWAGNVYEMWAVRRISAFQVIGGWVRFRPEGQEEEVEAPVHDIVGMRVEYDARLDEDEQWVTSPREIGTGGPVPMQDPSFNDYRPACGFNPDPEGRSWNEENMVHFDIDGEGGEIITEVHVAEEAKAVKLITNRGREGYFGEGRRHEDSWKVMRAEEGRIIAGLVMSFGKLSGWTQRDKRRSHWRSSVVTILTVPDNVEHRRKLEEERREDVEEDD